MTRIPWTEQSGLSNALIYLVCGMLLAMKIYDQEVATSDEDGSALLYGGTLSYSLSGCAYDYVAQLRYAVLS